MINPRKILVKHIGWTLEERNQRVGTEIQYLSIYSVLERAEHFINEGLDEK